MEGWVSDLVNSILGLLPTSPFRSFIDNFSMPEYLGWLNWFVPIGDFLTILSAWLVAVAMFYVFSLILRWVKLIS